MKIIHTKKKITKQILNIKSKKELVYKDYQQLLSTAKLNKKFEHFIQSINFDITLYKINNFMVSMVSQNHELDLLMRNIEPLINSSMTLKEQNMFKLKTIFAFYH